MSNNLPYQSTERHFRRYESHIKTIVDTWPNVNTFDPAPFSVVTVSNRLRDAKNSLKDNLWETDINMKKFLEICDQIKVTIKNGLVRVGPQEGLKEALNTTSVNDTAITVTDPDVKLLEAMFTVQQGFNERKVPIWPTTVKITNDALREQLRPIVSNAENLYNIAIDGDVDRGFTIF